MTGKPIKGKASASKPGWQLSSKLITADDSMFGQTLAPVYAEHAKYTTALYNDAPPEGAGNSHFAHAKGVLAMDKDTGFWLVHSVPNYAPDFSQSYKYPESGHINGQTLLCISFNTKAEGNDIAEQLTYMRPNIYDLQITADVEALAPAIRILENQKWPTDANEHTNQITSIKGEQFMSFSRNAKSAGDLYSEYVAPSLETDLLVETWRRGAGGPLHSNCTTPHYKVYNIEEVNLKLNNGVKGQPEETSPWKVKCPASFPEIVQSSNFVTQSSST